MSIDDTSDLSRRRQYTATASQTTFDYPFRIFADTDIVVYVGSTLQTLSTNYTVTGVGNGTGGTIVFGTPRTAGDVVTIYSDTTIERTSDYQQNGPWTSSRLNDEFDRNVVIDQEQRHYLRRTLRGSILEAELSALPAATSRASKYLYFDASGNPVAADGSPSDPLTVLRQTGVAAAGQTVINTTDAYTPGSDQLSLYINGEKQVVDVDYTETDADTLTLTTGMLEGDRYEILIGEVRAITLLTPVKRREDFVMTEGATTVTLTGGTYTPNNNEIEVFMNGALLRPSVHYSEASSTTITLTTAAQEGDEIAVIVGQAYDPVVTGGPGDTAEVTYPSTAAEAAAGVTPSDLTYPPGNVFRYGCVNDGTTVDTPSFTQALAAHPESFHVPYTGTKYVIGKLTIPSNVRGVFDPGVYIEDSGALLSSDSFINITGSNVDLTMSGATITQAGKYVAVTSTRHGIYVTGSGVTIRGGAVTLCDADGLHIAAQSVRVYNFTGTANRRDGIRISSGRYVTLEDCRGQQSSGLETASGITIVPPDSTGYLEAIRIVRPVTRQNDGAGVLVDLANWNTATKEVDIIVDSPYSYDDGALYGSAATLRAGVTLRNAYQSALGTCRGVVRVLSPTIVDSPVTGLHVHAWGYDGPRLEIIDPVVINPNQLDSTDGFVGSGISLTSSNTYAQTAGNVHLIRPKVYDYDNNLAANSVYALHIVEAANAFQNVTVEDYYTNSTAPLYFSDDSISTNVKITYAQMQSVTLTATPYTATERQHGTVFDNAGQTAAREVDLPNITTQMAAAGIELEFHVKANGYYITLDPNGTDQIQPGSTGAGKYLRASDVGERIRIKAVDTSTWHIISQVGTWVFEP